MSDKPLTISRLAKSAGTSVETIRYYQRIDLLEEPRKPASGYRVYTKSAVAHLKFIQRAKELGFTLGEIKELLSLDSDACDQTRELAQHKVRLIQNKIADLQAMETVLNGLLNACQNNPAHAGCPIIEVLSRD